MKYTCLQCNRISPDPNLYCQESYCPAERSPILLDFGEWLGDIEIVKLVTVLHTAVVYEAMHMGQKVYLKTAHPGVEHTERIKREAEFLRTHQHPMLPKLRPPYAGTELAENNSCGKTVLGGHLIYFYLFSFWEGEPLKDTLAQNPQLWINHVGWITIGLAEVINLMHNENFYHLGLMPEGILVQFDTDDVTTPRILLIDLGVVSRARDLGDNWYSFLAPPAYTAPELLETDKVELRPTFSSDVYGIGLILYELLIGESAYAHEHQGEEEIRETVLSKPPRRHIRDMSRREDVSRVASVAEQAVSRDMQDRYSNVAQIGQILVSLFGEAPEKKRSPWPKTSTIMIVVAALLTLAFLITVAVSIGEFAG